MHLSRSPYFFGFSALGLLLGAHAAGCGGGTSTHSTATTTGTGGGTGGVGGTTTSTTTTGSGGTGGSTGTGFCGDGVINGNGSEQCDLGSANGTGVGCNSSCQFDCMGDSDCNTAGNPCPGTATCGMVMVMGQPVAACQPGTPLADGTSCGTNLYCVGNNCTAPSCGDGVVEGNEECDNGSANGPGTGCESTCKFTCLASDTTRNCSSTNTCVISGTCQADHTCLSGGNVADGTSCTGGKCESGTCVVSSCSNQTACTACALGGSGGGVGICTTGNACTASSCGDGCVDTTKGEQCEPPNSATCDGSCHFKPAVCGDGVIQHGEQCDDGNKYDLDGCDSKCNYEVVTRMTAIAISGNTAAAALKCKHPANALGAKAITSLALGQLNPALTTDVNNGTVNVLTQFIGLSDLTGVAATGFTIGVLDGNPDPAKGAPMNNPIDWWFLADPATVSMGLPTGLFTTASIVNRNLTAGPNNVTLTINLAGSAAPLSMLNASIAGTINGTPAPNAPAPPPSALAPGLVVFQTITANGTGQGLCGDVTVASLANIPVPSILATGGGTAACSENYVACVAPMTPTSAGSTCNSLLDVLVGGCKVLGGLITAINATQPDVAANGTVTKLVAGAGKKITPSPTSDMDAYSSYFTFTANRAHFTGETCTATTDCQTGLTCTAGACK